MQIRQGLTIGFITILIIIGWNGDASAAVTSSGEINVDGDSRGRVPASSNVILILTLGIDRSLAEPGEEIKTIETKLPVGFSVSVNDVRSVTRDGQSIAHKVLVPTGLLQIMLTKEVSDFSNSLYEIVFKSKTPSITNPRAEFKIRLTNLKSRPIGAYIKPGNIDGEPNNDMLSLQIIPNVPPAPVKGLKIKVDTSGENDVLITWQPSQDGDVSGYFIYRDGKRITDQKNREIASFVDLNVLPGKHSYTMEVYKTSLLRSRPAAVVIVNVGLDTVNPTPPKALQIQDLGGIVNIIWQSSNTPDVEKYQISFGTSTDKLKPLTNGVIEAEPDKQDDYIFSLEQQLKVGKYVYAVEAVDEVGNRSTPITQVLRILGEPFPAVITPLSNNEKFNQVTFPIRTIEDAEGKFMVLIFDINGMLIKRIQPEDADQDNEKNLKWEGKNEDGEIVESGIYIYQVQVGESYKNGTLIVAK